MKHMRSNKKGFTMVELLVVLVIVAILAAVATPIYLANVKRARASEAVATMSLVRQALRDYRISGANYFNVGTDGATGPITNPLPTSVTTAGVPTPATAGVNIEDGVSQYFANTAFTVDAQPTDLDGLSGMFTNPNVVDFLISANGLRNTTRTVGQNFQCAVAADTNCATKPDEVATYRLEMDNSGRVFVCYDYGVTTAGVCDSGWSAY